MPSEYRHRRRQSDLEHRTGHTEDGMFFESLGGSLIQSRATYPDIVEHVVDTDETRSFRLSTNTLGGGFVECVSDSTLLAIRDAQPVDMQGTAPEVPVLEGDGSAGIGRFGWKCQHRSLESFASDAYLNEMGITSALFPEENTSSGVYVGFGTQYDPVPDPEDFIDVAGFVLFMRSTKVPPRGPIPTSTALGKKSSIKLGAESVTWPPLPRPHRARSSMEAPSPFPTRSVTKLSILLATSCCTILDRRWHPIQPLPEFADTANKMRTAPLWGVRTRNRLMHDALSFTYLDAIQRHAGQAASVTALFNGLSDTDKANIYAFLGSL